MICKYCCFYSTGKCLTKNDMILILIKLKNILLIFADVCVLPCFKNTCLNFNCTTMFHYLCEDFENSLSLILTISTNKNA